MGVGREEALLDGTKVVVTPLLDGTEVEAPLLDGITVVIPARLTTEEDVAWLKEAIDSVEKQTKHCMIIVVLNGCTVDYTPEESNHLSVLHSAEGLSKARNAGVRASKTTWFFPLDANDWLPENAMEIAWRSRPEKGFLYGSTMMFRGDRKLDDRQLYKAREYSFNDVMKFVYFPNGALQRKADWITAGGWNEELPFLEDWDYWLTAGEKGICGIAIPDVLYWYRQHSGIISTNKHTVAWEEVRKEIRAKHASIYKGDFPMGCCGNKKSTVKVTYTPPSKAALIPGADGMILIEYVGGNVGNVIYYGAITKTRYQVGGNHPRIYIDAKDAVTGDKKHPGFLEITNHSKPEFVEVKDG